MTTRIENYIIAGNKNKRISLQTVLGLRYMHVLDQVLSYHVRKFDVDKLDKILQEIMSGPLTDGIMNDIKLAMRLYGE